MYGGSTQDSPPKTAGIEPGSSEIVSLRSAEGLDEPQVKARGTGRGHRRAIAYRVKPIEGQKVTFLESGPSTGGMIGVAKGRDGTLRFSAADGAAARRKIVALVEQDGQVRDRIEIASYRAGWSSVGSAAARPAPRRCEL